MPHSHNLVTVTIRADGKGDFTYDPSTVVVNYGDRISWTSNQLGPFAISFLNATPLNAMSLSSTLVNGEHKIEARQIVTRSPGHHHYAVAIAIVHPQDRSVMGVSLDAGCPDIVVSGD